MLDTDKYLLTKALSVDNTTNFGEITLMESELMEVNNNTFIWQAGSVQERVAVVHTGTWLATGCPVWSITLIYSKTASEHGCTHMTSDIHTNWLYNHCLCFIMSELVLMGKGKSTRSKINWVSFTTPQSKRNRYYQSCSLCRYQYTCKLLMKQL